MASETGTPSELEGFEELARAAMGGWKVPGLAVTVVRADEAILSRGYGVRDAERDLPVTPDTIFAIASCSKAFTCAALGILVDEGALDWDTPVREYMPSFRMYDDFASERITPRDLVCHRSGLPRHDLAWYGSAATREELVERLRYLRPSADLRTTYQYQNLMYMAAGHLIEHLTGRTWEEWVRERIFLPLGMTNSNTAVAVSQQSPDHAAPYREREGALERMPFYEQWAIGPAGSINSSVDDLSRWLHMHLGGGACGEVRVLSEGQVRQMRTPHTPMPADEKYPEVLHPSYGLGWTVQSYRGHEMAQHGGNIDGFSSLVTLLPRAGIGIAALTNLNGNPVPWVATAWLCDRLLGLDPAPWLERAGREREEREAGEERSKRQADEERGENTRPAHPLEAYAGEYAHSGYGVARWEVRDDELALTYNGMTFPVRHYHYETWDVEIERFDMQLKATFATNARGDVASVAMPLESTVPDIVFTRLPDARLRERAYLERFAGEYDLNGATVTIALLGEGRLLARLPSRPRIALTPRTENEFVVEGVTGVGIRFETDDAGAITGAVITQPGLVQSATRR